MLLAAYYSDFWNYLLLLVAKERSLPQSKLKVELPMWDFKSALPTADGKIKDFAAASQGLRCVPSGGAKGRAAVTLPSSDEEGVSGICR